MGPQRSIDKAVQNGTKTAPRYYKEWSRRYGWVESARQYDEQQAFITIQEAGAPICCRSVTATHAAAGDDDPHRSQKCYTVADSVATA